MDFRYGFLLGIHGSDCLSQRFVCELLLHSKVHERHDVALRAEWYRAVDFVRVPGTKSHIFRALRLLRCFADQRHRVFVGFLIPSFSKKTMQNCSFHGCFKYRVHPNRSCCLILYPHRKKCLPACGASVNRSARERQLGPISARRCACDTPALLDRLFAELNPLPASWNAKFTAVIRRFCTTGV